MSAPEVTTAGWTRSDLDVAGTATAVFEAGGGDPVVVLCGAALPGVPHDRLLALASSYRVVRPDPPGFGESADDPTIDSIDDYRLHYLDLLDHLGIDRFHLVGHFLGGAIAARFAAEHAKRLRSLVLVAPVGLRVPEAPTADVFRLRHEELLDASTCDAALRGELAGAAGELDGLVAQYREATSLARLLWQRAYDPKLSRWLHRAQVPTLLLWGEEDRIVPAAQAAVWASLLPSAETVVVPGAGHLVLAERLAAVEAIASFVAAHGR